jgi:16S rRNA (cytosine1402-N4)-methyltransferase
VVNDEMNQLDRGLQAAVELLCPEARLVVISYHSLEDRLVKNFIRDRASSPVSPEGKRDDTRSPVLRVITKKPVTPSAEEIDQNPRSRSARMRVAEKV